MIKSLYLLFLLTLWPHQAQAVTTDLQQLNGAQSWQHSAARTPAAVPGDAYVRKELAGVNLELRGNFGLWNRSDKVTLRGAKELGASIGLVWDFH